MVLQIFRNNSHVKHNQGADFDHKISYFHGLKKAPTRAVYSFLSLFVLYYWHGNFQRPKNYVLLSTFLGFESANTFIRRLR